MRSDEMNATKMMTMVLAAAMLLAAGCEAASEDIGGAAPPDDENTDHGNVNEAPGPNNDDPDPPPPAEEVEEYDFSTPAIIDHNVYIANETLNAAAIIDSRNLGIRTVLTGDRPTEVVGPAHGTSDGDARAMVLNEGSSTVTVIDPADQSTTHLSVLSDSNRIAMAPDGRRAVVWFDPDHDSAGDLEGNLSAVSVVTEDETYQVSVGFRIRDVRFDAEGGRALVFSNDGVSVLELDDIDGDQFVQPIDVIPDSHSQEHLRDLQLETTSNGEYVVAYRADRTFLLVTEVENEETYALDLAVPPTDVAFRETDDATELLAMLRADGEMMRISVPDGLQELAAAQQPSAALMNDDDDNGDDGDDGDDNGDDNNGDDDNGDDDNGDDDNGDDNGDDDNGDDDNGDDDNGDDNGDGDNGDDDNGDDDNGDDDNGDDDNGDDNGDNGDNGDDDNGEEDEEEYEHVAFVELPFVGPGAMELSADGTHAVLFTTVLDEKRVVLFDFVEEQSRVIAMQKTIQGATADDTGETFLVIHDREAGSTDGLSPGDPEYVARKWGFTVLDVATGSTQTILTELDIEDIALWSPQAGHSMAYMTYAEPTEFEDKTALRDVLRINLRTFGMQTFRLPSIPDGLGVIPEAEQVFINQIHPQGRMTFVDVHDGQRQTITGYQLNAGIE